MRKECRGSPAGIAPWRTLLSMCGVVSVMLASATASAGQQRPVRSLLEMRHEEVVIQQWDISCAAAALATILTYQHGDPVPEREITRGLIQREEYLARPELVRVRQGFSLLDLKRYAERRGYKGVGYGAMTVDDLVEHAPLLVPVNIRGYNHFVVFRGVYGGNVFLADPAYGNRTMSVSAFEDAWIDMGDFGKVGFVVERRDGLKPPNRLRPRPSDIVAVPGPVVRQAVSSFGVR